MSLSEGFRRMSFSERFTAALSVADLLRYPAPVGLNWVRTRYVPLRLPVWTRFDYLIHFTSKYDPHYEPDYFSYPGVPNHIIFQRAFSQPLLDMAEVLRGWKASLDALGPPSTRLTLPVAWTPIPEINLSSELARVTPLSRFVFRQVNPAKLGIDLASTLHTAPVGFDLNGFVQADAENVTLLGKVIMNRAARQERTP